MYNIIVKNKEKSSKGGTKNEKIIQIRHNEYGT